MPDHSKAIASEESQNERPTSRSATNTSTSLEVPTASTVRLRMNNSLQVVLEWRHTALPSRFSVGSKELRKLAIRVREQPTNFMIIMNQSLLAARRGQKVCRAGLTAALVLVSGDYPERDKKAFVAETVKTIRTSASDLEEHTSEMKSKFRLLRTAVLDLHKDLKEGSRKRNAFFARLSRVLSKDVRVCEDELQKIEKDFDDVENTLNLITRWWQKIESEADYLQMNGESPLVVETNKITLKEIKDGFSTLMKYFGDYLDAMSRLFDENIVYLSEVNQEYVKSIGDCRILHLSAWGRLQPGPK